MFDLLVYNGTIYTMESEHDIFTAMGIKNGKIQQLFAELPPNYDQLAHFIVDAKGKAILPAFTDSHSHFMTTAAFHALGLPISELIDGKLTPTTMDGVKKKVVSYAETQSKNAPIFCTNYVIASMEKKRLPTTQEIDSWLPNRDVIFLSIDGHASSYSSSALQKMGFDPTKHSGILTGEEHEFNYDKMNKIIEKALTLPKLIQGVQAAVNYAIKHGVVGIHTMESLSGKGKDKSLWLLTKLVKAFPLYFRIYPQVRDIKEIKYLKNKMQSPRAGGCGAWEMDGAVGAQTAAFYQDYLNQPGNQGELLYPKDKLIPDLERAYQEGFQITSHAIGTRAIDHLLDAVESVFQNHNDFSNKYRWRVDHFEFPTHSAVDRAVNKLNLLISPQPGFNWIDANYPGMQTYDKYLSPDIVALQNPLQTIVKKGGTICGSSDSPIQSFDPFLQIHGMVNFPIEGEAISVYEALRTYTYNGAYATFEEETRGTLKVGKSADFIILEQDPFKIDNADLLNVQIAKTFIQGKEITPFSKSTWKIIIQSIFKKMPPI